MVTGPTDSLPSDLPQLPLGWEWKPLLDYVPPGRGISYGIVQPGKHDPAGIPILRAENVQNSRVELKEVMRVSPSIESKYKRTRLSGGELLITLVGAYFGKVAIAPKLAAGYNTARAVGVVPVRSDEVFLSHALQSPVCQRYIQRWATTTAQPTLNLGDVGRIPIPSPPPKARQEIAAVIGALDDKTEWNRRMNSTLEAMARSLFQSWFVDFNPVRAKLDGRQPPGLDAATAALFSNELEDSELGPIPKGWRCGTIGELGGRILDKIEERQEWASEILIDLSRMPQRSIALGEWGLGVELTTSVTRFSPNDVLFGAIRPYFHKVGIAPVHGVTNVSVFVIRAIQSFDCAFLAALCSLDTTVEFATRVSKGTKMPVVSWPDFANYPIAVPAPELRRAFAEMVAPLYERIVSNIRESRTLATLRDTLLPKLLSGEIRALT
jgi:type I restriction enzyme S subunit